MTTGLLLLLIFGLLGFLIAQTEMGDRVARGSAKMMRQMGSFLDTDQGASSQDRSDLPARGFSRWVSSAPDLPDDFRTWYLSLDADEAAQFSSALKIHSQETGLNLAKLVGGELQNQPDLRNVYVEAVTIYSQAYRKAREAIEAEKDTQDEQGTEKEEDQQTVEGKVVAEKQKSRRLRKAEQLSDAISAA